MNKLILRWTDQDGKPQSKRYDDEQSARKAKKWLLDRGALQVDIAIVIV